MITLCRRHTIERRRRTRRAAARAGVDDAIFATTGKRIRALSIGKQLDT